MNEKIKKMVEKKNELNKKIKAIMAEEKKTRHHKAGIELEKLYHSEAAADFPPSVKQICEKYFELPKK